MCDRCPHAEHFGVCGAEIEVQGIIQSCLCLVPTPRSLDRHEMHVDALVAESEMDWLQRQEPRRRGPYLKYRRM